MIATTKAVKRMKNADTSYKASFFACLIHNFPCFVRIRNRKEVEKLKEMEKQYAKEVSISNVLKQLRVLKKFAKQSLGKKGYQKLWDQHSVKNIQRLEFEEKEQEIEK